jgi:hypothetical protein
MEPALNRFDIAVVDDSIAVYIAIIQRAAGRRIAIETILDESNVGERVLAVVVEVGVTRLAAFRVATALEQTPDHLGITSVDIPIAVYVAVIQRTAGWRISIETTLHESDVSKRDLTVVVEIGVTFTALRAAALKPAPDRFDITRVDSSIAIYVAIIQRAARWRISVEAVLNEVEVDQRDQAVVVEIGVTRVAALCAAPLELASDCFDITSVDSPIAVHVTIFQRSARWRYSIETLLDESDIG